MEVKRPAMVARRNGASEKEISAESRKFSITFQPNTGNLVLPPKRGSRE